MMQDIDTVFYHGNCPDGIIARELLRSVYDHHVKFVPHYFKSLDKIPSRALFIDCSPKEDEIEACLRNGCKIADHHASFRPLYEKWKDEFPNSMIFGENAKLESGARLAWHIIGRPIMYEELVNRVSSSDTFTKNEWFDDGREIAMAINFFGNEFTLNMLPHCKLIAKTIKQQQVKLAMNSVKINGIFFANAYHISDAADYARQNLNCQIFVGWVVTEKGVQYSLRGSEGHSVRGFAEAMGGGGHDMAAGYSIPVSEENPIHLFLLDWNRYVQQNHR